MRKSCTRLANAGEQAVASRFGDDPTDNDQRRIDQVGERRERFTHQATAPSQQLDAEQVAQLRRMPDIDDGQFALPLQRLCQIGTAPILGGRLAFTGDGFCTCHRLE